MDRSEREQWLAEFLASEEWLHLVTPALRARLAELEQRTMRCQAWEDARVYQGGWSVLLRMLTDPKGFFAEAKSE
jgi:hypothetical protein